MNAAIGNATIQEGTLQDITGNDTKVDNTFAQQSQGGSFDDLYVNTPAIKSPAARPTMNAARVTGVTEETTQAGQTFMKVHVALTDEGKDTDIGVFLPEAFIADIKVDPTTLSTEKTITKNGKEAPSEQDSYSQRVRNTSGDATLQTLGRIAAEAGQSIGQPSTFSELVTGLNSALTGVDVYVLRSVDKNPSNPEFANVLRARRIVSANTDINHKRYAAYWKPFQQ